MSDKDDSSVGSTDGPESSVDDFFVKSQVAGASDAPTGSAEVADTPSGASSASATSTGKYFSPYFDMTLWTTDLTAISKASGLRDFTLAFMQTTVDANGNVILTNGVPSMSFGGLGTRTPESASTMINEVKNVEAGGGTVTISMGGASGLDAAVYAAAHGLTAARLQAEYQSVITAYGVNHLDFDIENTATVDNFAANKLRDKAIAGLETANPGLKVSFTLATTAKGLGALPSGEVTNAANDASAARAGIGNDLGILKQAVADKVTLGTVNIMAMDYYDGNAKEAAPSGTGVNGMYTNAVSAANATERQLTNLGIASTTKIGITPMIGQNDDSGGAGTDGVDEVFTLADAVKLEAFGASTSWVAGLGEWELLRDSVSTTNDLGAASISYSGVVQKAYQFATDFHQIETVPAASGGTANAIAAESAVGGSGSTFVFTPNFGQEAIADFYQHYAGSGHETITLPSSEFADFGMVLREAAYDSAGAVITDPTNGDKLTLQNVTHTILASAGGDFKFGR